MDSKLRNRKSADLSWSFLSLSEMSSQTFFNLARLRTDVFVVEQQCVYPELDDYDADETTLHVLGYSANHELLACARILFTDSTARQSSSQQVRIGRVAVLQSHRGAGIARQMMLQILQRVRIYSEEKRCQLQIELSAQTYATQFYESLGFATISKEYMEDGIEHVDMRLKSA